MRTHLESMLAGFAKKVLAREKPMIIGVTGSVGKSSAKDAIGVVLQSRGRVRMSPRSYNSGSGVALTILGEPSPGAAGTKWLGTLWRCWAKSGRKDPDYPPTLVLEMAADRPGDIAKLAALARPNVAVVTAVGEAHAEYLGDLDSIAKEKGTLVSAADPNGLVVLNRDDERVWAMRERTKAKVVSFGFDADADVRALPDSVTYACTSDRECGMHLKIVAGGATVPVFLPHVMGRHGAYAALAAAAVGLSQDMNLIEISNALGRYTPPPGRMRHVPGIKHTVLIDDTYNASTTSVLAALDVLREIPKPAESRSFAVLGDMLELGALSEEGHRAVGKKAAASADFLVFVGERMRDARRAAEEAGFAADRLAWFATPEEAGLFVQDHLKTTDFVLVKGSRGMKMEKVVKELMADPLTADQVLCSHVE